MTFLLITLILYLSITPQNSEVHAEVGHTYEDSYTTYSATMSAFEKQQDIYANATYLTQPNSKYNCSSYALYNASTSNNRWLEHIGTYGCNQYFRDGSYERVDRPAAGDIIVYGYNAATDIGPTHVGIIQSIYRDEPNIIVSKWGVGGFGNIIGNTALM